jgi:hypothetical protein
MLPCFHPQFPPAEREKREGRRSTEAETREIRGRAEGKKRSKRKAGKD